MYRGSGGQHLSDACKAMLDGARLLEQKTKGGSSWEFGLGMKMPEEETADVAEGAAVNAL